MSREEIEEAARHIRVRAWRKTPLWAPPRFSLPHAGSERAEPRECDANGARRPTATRLLSPADRLALVVVACQFAIALLGGVRTWPLAAALLVIAMLVFVLAHWATRSRVGDLAHAFVTPYAAVAILFETSGGVAGIVNHSRWDATFSAIDERFFASVMRAFIEHVELNTLDAFPSGHTTVALVVALVGARAFPRWIAPLALTAAAIVFSTVYLGYHYVVDVVAGIALAVAMPLVLPVLRRVCGAR